MKSAVNKFDYPTAATHAYKFYAVPDQDQDKSQALKHRYQQVNREERYNERAKVKMEQERKKELSRRHNKKKLQAEIEHKKHQLMELEQTQNRALEAERQAHELAKIKQEQDHIKAIEQEAREKESQAMAQNRFITALRRMETEKDTANKKVKQAQFRRKTAEETEKIERNKAIKYRQTIEQMQRNAPEQKKFPFTSYKQPLGRIAYNNTVDYTKTYLHNPLIIIPNTEQGVNAIQKGEEANNKQRERSLRKKQLKQQHRRISIQRGDKAMQKLKLQKEYEQYSKEQQNNAFQYNIERIQAGKKNQYIGFKPTTLSQMQMQQKIRRQQRFQEMFFGGHAPEVFDRPAHQYTIEQARLGNSSVESQSQEFETGNTRSNLATISQGHYSFESQAMQDFPATNTQNSPNQQQLNNYQPNQYNLNPPINPIQEYKQNRRIEYNSSKHKEELNYSQSEQDSRI